MGWPSLGDPQTCDIALIFPTTLVEGELTLLTEAPPLRLPKEIEIKYSFI